MKARAKSSSASCPIWVQGDYIKEPPIRPADGAKRPVGHYIDKGGYPGANVCEIIPETLCKDTGSFDCCGKSIFERDLLLYETETEFGYFLVWDVGRAADIVSGEIIQTPALPRQNIKIIGNALDFPDFIEAIRHFADTETKGKIPYLPALNTIQTSLPFMELTCTKCGHTTLSCSFIAVHKECGGYFAADFATKVYRKGEKKAPA